MFYGIQYLCIFGPKQADHINYFIMKCKLIALFLILFVFEVLAKENFFSYWKMNKSMKSTVDDYIDNYRGDTILLLSVKPFNKDEFSFRVQIDVGSMFNFIESAPCYYSLYRHRVVFIYNGDEELYNPNPDQMGLMFDFLSNFVDTREFAKCDWLKSEFIMNFKSPIISDYPSVEYIIKDDTILRKEIIENNVIYPRVRSKARFIPFVKRNMH